MKCPNCGEKLWAKDIVHMPDGDELYRLRHCKECGEVVYTCEFVVEKTDSFVQLWNENRCGHTSRIKTDRKRPRYSKAELAYIRDHCYDKCKDVARVLKRNSIEGVRKKMYEARKEKEKE